MQTYDEESVLDTNPGSMRARIQACLPGRSGIIVSADVGMRISAVVADISAWAMSYRHRKPFFHWPPSRWV